MGKGDKKSKKGKIAIGSYGNSRKRNATKLRLKKARAQKSTGSAQSEEQAKPKKTARKKSEA